MATTILMPLKHRTLNLGYFATEEEAAEAYNVAASEHFGDFAFLNTIDESN